MARTEVRSNQILDGGVKRDDLNTTQSGQAVVRRLVAGDNITFASTGADTGTGDVTINSSGGGSTEGVHFNTVTTTDDTETTVDTLSLSDNEMVMFTAEIAARLDSTTDKSYWAKIEGGVRRNDGSGAVLVGTRKITEDDEGTPGYVADIDVNGNDLRIRVTGAGGETVDWSCKLRWQTDSNIEGNIGVDSLNGETNQIQTFATGTSGTNFNISSSSGTHTFNIPDASASARGLVTSGSQTIGGEKTFDADIITKNIEAAADDTYDIGDTTNMFAAIHVGNVINPNDSLYLTATDSNSGIYLSSGNTTRYRLAYWGALLPQGTSGTLSIGSSSAKLFNIYSLNYSNFTGTHVFKVKADESLTLGDAVYLDEVSGELMKCASSDIPYCYGIIAFVDDISNLPQDYDENGDPIQKSIEDSEGNTHTSGSYAFVAALGDSRTEHLPGAKVCDEGGQPSRGDYLVTANKAGFLKKKSNNTMDNTVVAKLMRSVTFDGNGEATGVYVYLLN